VGPKSKTVNAVTDRLVAAFGPELAILRDVPAEELARIGGSPLTEAITRLRRGEVIKDAGYDGEYRPHPVVPFRRTQPFRRAFRSAGPGLHGACRRSCGPPRPGRCRGGHPGGR